MDSWNDELMNGYVNVMMNALVGGVVDGWAMILMVGWID